MCRVSLQEAQEMLAVLVQQVLQGEEVIITQDDRPLVRMIPAKQTRPRAHFGSAKGLIAIADDFDEPLDDFKDYM
jgi:prevent-host-death family protein